MKFVVIGAGAMGRLVARHLRDLGVATSRISKLVVADSNIGDAREVAASLAHRAVSAAKVDAGDVAQTARLLKDSFVVVNCGPYQLNVPVMSAALRARCHYIDLGGMSRFTLQQFPLDLQFRRIDRLAILGMGNAPGTSNMLAGMAVAHLDEVSELHVLVAFREHRRYVGRPPFATFSMHSIDTELTAPVPPIREYQVVRVIARGRRGGQKVTRIYDCRSRGLPDQNLGVDIDTTLPPTVVSLRLLEGGITARGALPPDQAVPLRWYRTAMESCGMVFRSWELDGWRFPNLSGVSS